MAQRNSRKGKGRKKQPELRTGGGRAAKAQRSRVREEAGATTTTSGPVLRMRPSGAAGMAVLLLLAWAAVAAVLVAGLLLDRWNVLGYPDSAWLYVAFGCAAVAPAVGRVSRSPRDTDAWGIQALVVPLALLVVEAIAGPDCPVGGECAAVGARGSLGLPLSFVVVAVLAFVAWALARWMYRAAVDRRPSHGRVRYGALVVAFLTLTLFVSSVVAAALVGADLLLRDTPALALAAEDEVVQECFGLGDSPQLVARAAPAGYNPDWTTFAVRRAGEDRKGIGKEGLPDRWATYDEVHPYEATASFNEDGDVVGVTCRRVGPGTGNATADDLTQEEPESNPLSPKTTGAEFLPRFFTQGVAGPSEEARQRQAQEAAAAKKAKG